jgi:hypothetical protein
LHEDLRAVATGSQPGSSTACQFRYRRLTN